MFSQDRKNNSHLISKFQEISSGCNLACHTGEPEKPLIDPSRDIIDCRFRVVEL